jgi:SAM-dependent methyltransferase
MDNKILKKLKNIFIKSKEKIYRTLGIRSKIYKIAYKRWSNSSESYSSGPGTRLEYIKNPYIDEVEKYCKEKYLMGKVFVDLGCGDFEIGSEICKFSSKYIGVDVVEEVIKQNRKNYEIDNVNFMKKDIVKEDIPDGDVAFLRQVLQHMSNEEIKSVLEKIKKYKYIFITEHYPGNENVNEKNLDIETGSGTRLSKDSAVYLTEEPFNLKESALSEILSVKLRNPLKGYVKTFLYKPER